MRSTPTSLYVLFWSDHSLIYFWQLLQSVALCGSLSTNCTTRWCKVQEAWTPQNINKFTWYKHLVNVDKVWYWKVHRPFPALCESRAGIVGDCTILWFLPDPHLSRSIRILGSPAYHMDAQRLKLAQSMPRSTVQAFLTKFGISGREEGGWQWRGRAREEGASIVFNADLIL